MLKKQKNIGNIQFYEKDCLILRMLLFKDVIDIYYKGELCNSTITLLKLK